MLTNKRKRMDKSEDINQNEEEHPKTKFIEKPTKPLITDTDTPELLNTAETDYPQRLQPTLNNPSQSQSKETLNDDNEIIPSEHLTQLTKDNSLFKTKEQSKSETLKKQSEKLSKLKKLLEKKKKPRYTNI